MLQRPFRPILGLLLTLLLGACSQQTLIVA